MDIRNFLKNASLVVGSCVVTFIALEAAVRMKYGSQPFFIYPQVIHENTHYGYKMKPNQKGTYTWDKPVETNSFGFRDTEWAVPKSKGKIRIMCIGDSFTFGNAVRIEDTYPKILEKRLRAVNPNVEVISTAAAGWTTYHELHFLKNEGLNYEPDIVILGFFLNDFVSKPAANIVFTREGRHEERPPWLRWLPYEYIFLAKRSALVSYVRQRLYNLKGKSDFTTLLLQNKLNLIESERIQDTISYLLEMKTILNEKKVKFILALIPPVNFFWLQEKTLDYVEYMGQVSKENHISFIDLADGFRKSENTDKLYLYPWDNHLSPKGHTHAAEQLFYKVKETL